MTPLPFALSLLAAGAVAAPSQPTPAGLSEKPRLVVILVADQMRADYVDSYGGRWTGGLRRLLDRGALFPQAAYPYLNTLTCVGHATISTGAFPRTHGIVQNAWGDPASGKPVGCSQDPSRRLVSLGEGAPDAGGQSAWRLELPAFPDELRAQARVPPKVAVFSLKAYSAVMLAGRRPDAVLWPGTGSWMTSSAFADPPLPVLFEIAKAASPAGALGSTWERQRPATDYDFEDDAPDEQPPAGWSRTFPHPVGGAKGETGDASHTQWLTSPFADEALAALATTAVAKLGMGKGPGTDYLAISFSALDFVGHTFGPRSHEVQDLLLRLDATLGRLLADLDRLVGPERYLVAVTADHGVAPIPEQLTNLGVDAGRVAPGEVRSRVEKALVPFLGPGPHVAAAFTELYFAAGVMERLREKPEALKAAVEAAASAPGVARVFLGDDLARGVAAQDPELRAAALSYRAGRSGDLILLPKPYWVATSRGTTHGTLYRYDAAVPVLLAGPGIKAGRYLGPASPADIAPTLAYLTGITLARADGRILKEALEPSAAKAKAAPGR